MSTTTLANCPIGLFLSADGELCLKTEYGSSSGRIADSEPDNRKGPIMTQVEWTMLHPRMTVSHLGFLPGFLHEENEARAAKQLDVGYRFAGGWRPQKGFKLTASNCLTYPGDPPLKPLAKATLRDETIFFYENSIVAVVQPDRSFEACRMD